MKKIQILLFILFTLFMQISNDTSAQDKKAPQKTKKDYLVTLSTQFGEMKILLYEETPKHKANFIKLAKEGFYNDLLFHRVIKDFMLQGGDPDSKNAKEGQMLGRGGLDYRVDAEFKNEIYHKKGVIAAARDGNPQKASSSCQFYIVQGKQITDAELEMLEKRKNFKYSDSQKNMYKNVGGTPFLDQDYTVYGEVIQGIEIIDKIAEQETDSNDRPKKDVKMQLKVEELSKKKITKMYGYVYQN